MFRKLKKSIYNIFNEEIQIFNWHKNSDDEWVHNKTGDRVFIHEFYDKENKTEIYRLELWTKDFVLPLYSNEEKYLSERFLGEFLQMNDSIKFDVKHIHYHPMMSYDLCKMIISQY